MNYVSCNVPLIDDNESIVFGRQQNNLYLLMKNLTQTFANKV